VEDCTRAKWGWNVGREKGRILIVEDEPTIAKTLRLSLEAEGYEVRQAGDGLEALNQVRRDPPDLILLDVMLPKFDGFKVCRLLKFDKHTGHIPIILSSARNSDADMEKGRKAGADAYVVKPFDLERLIGLIRSHMRPAVSSST
jgi:DNA-binding response OmpR family regulator